MKKFKAYIKLEIYLDNIEAESKEQAEKLAVDNFKDFIDESDISEIYVIEET